MCFVNSCWVSYQNITHDAPAYPIPATPSHMMTLLVNIGSDKPQNSPAPVIPLNLLRCGRARWDSRVSTGESRSQPPDDHFQTSIPTNQAAYLRTRTTMTFLRTSAIVFAAGAAFLTTTSAQTEVGTWTEATVTNAETNLLAQVADNASYYAPNVTTAICLIAVEGLWTQTVAGTNYKFQVAGCAVNDASGLGPCANRECAKSDYDVIIFSQPWTSTVQVTSVTQHS